MRKKIGAALGVVIGILVVLAMVGYFFGARIALYFLLDRHVDADVKPIDAAVATQVELHTEDGLRLDAWDYRVAGPRGAVIVFSGLQGPSVTYLDDFGRVLQDHGYAALLVELRGVAGSDDSPTGGQEGGTGEVRDVRAGIDYLQRVYPGVPIAAWGTSMGGHTVLASLDYTDSLDAVIAASTYTSFGDMAQTYASGAGEPTTKLLEKRYGEFGKARAVDAIARTDVPVLLAWSREDSQVPPYMSERLAAAQPKAETFVVDGDNHFIVPTTTGGFAEPVATHPYAAAVVDFLDRSLGGGRR